MGDTIRGMVLALAYAASQSNPFSECFNLGSPDPITMHELAHKIVNIAVDLGLLAEPLPVRPHAFHYSQSFDDSWSRVPDITRAKYLRLSTTGFAVGWFEIYSHLLQDLLNRSGLAQAPDDSVRESPHTELKAPGKK